MIETKKKYNSWCVYNLVALTIFFLQGHNKPITVLALSPDRQTIYTGSHDGYITAWNSKNGLSFDAIYLITRT